MSDLSMDKSNIIWLESKKLDVCYQAMHDTTNSESIFPKANSASLLVEK